jgi:hypothetical protein
MDAESSDSPPEPIYRTVFPQKTCDVYVPSNISVYLVGIGRNIIQFSGLRN